MKINLVRNGVYPITRDSQGKKIGEIPETGYPVPGTIQGEGKLAGTPSIFIRTSGCNLRCSWCAPDGKLEICDTPFASHHADEKESRDVDEIVRTLKHNTGRIRHVVITGGEPATQPMPLVELVRSIKKKLRLHITLETNGTIYIPELTYWVDLFSISPKLSNSIPTPDKIKNMSRPVGKKFMDDHIRFRMNIPAIQQYINACYQTGSYYGDNPQSQPERRNEKDFQLKFVVSRETDAMEIKNTLLRKLHLVESSDVFLMPLGGSSEILAGTLPLAARLAVEYGWKLSPRLHIDIFDKKRRV